MRRFIHFHLHRLVSPPHLQSNEDSLHATDEYEPLVYVSRLMPQLSPRRAPAVTALLRVQASLAVLMPGGRLTPSLPLPTFVYCPMSP